MAVLFDAGIDGEGYGIFWDGQVWVRANRYAYEHSIEAGYGGPIPPGFTVRPTCDNRACARPSHMELVKGDSK